MQRLPRQSGLTSALVSRRAVLAVMSATGGAAALSACGRVGSVVSGGSSAEPSPSESSSGNTASSTVPAAPFDATKPYLQFGAESGAPVVDVYEDFLCPHCRTFHEAQGADLERHATDGDITLRVHPRPMLDSRSNPPGYSGRAANLAVAAFEESPALYFRVSDAFYANQPGPEGLTDDQLVELAVSAGVEQEPLARAAEAGTHVEWLTSVVEPEAHAKNLGTPTVFINGKQWEGNPEEPGALAKELSS